MTESTWSAEQLERIGDATELQIASARSEGGLSQFVTIWVVRAGSDIYVRSAYGPRNGWFTRAQQRGTGRIRVGGIEADVVFVSAPPEAHDAIHAA